MLPIQETTRIQKATLPFEEPQAHTNTHKVTPSFAHSVTEAIPPKIKEEGLDTLEAPRRSVSKGKARSSRTDPEVIKKFPIEYPNKIFLKLFYAFGVKEKIETEKLEDHRTASKDSSNLDGNKLTARAIEETFTKEGLSTTIARDKTWKLTQLCDHFNE